MKTTPVPSPLSFDCLLMILTCVKASGPLILTCAKQTSFKCTPKLPQQLRKQPSCKNWIVLEPIESEGRSRTGMSLVALGGMAWSHTSSHGNVCAVPPKSCERSHYLVWQFLPKHLNNIAWCQGLFPPTKGTHFSVHPCSKLAAHCMRDASAWLSNTSNHKGVQIPNDQHVAP